MKQVCTPTLVVAHSQSGSQSVRSVSQSVRSVCQVSQVSQSASQVSQVSQSVSQSVSESASEVSQSGYLGKNDATILATLLWVAYSSHSLLHVSQSLLR